VVGADDGSAARAIWEETWNPTNATVSVQGEGTICMAM